jgi:hypothetical protein
MMLIVYITGLTYDANGDGVVVVCDGTLVRGTLLLM